MNPRGFRVVGFTAFGVTGIFEGALARSRQLVPSPITLLQQPRCF